MDGIPDDDIYGGGGGHSVVVPGGPGSTPSYSVRYKRGLRSLSLIYGGRYDNDIDLSAELTSDILSV
jgi:hypothetical protein